jgi:hypothetical protein
MDEMRMMGKEASEFSDFIRKRKRRERKAGEDRGEEWLAAYPDKPNQTNVII